MKILLAIILIFPIFNIVAQNSGSTEGFYCRKRRIDHHFTGKKSPFRYL